MQCQHADAWHRSLAIPDKFRSRARPRWPPWALTLDVVASKTSNQAKQSCGACWEGCEPNSQMPPTPGLASGEAEPVERFVRFDGNVDPARAGSAFQPSAEQLQQRAQRFGSQLGATARSQTGSGSGPVRGPDFRAGIDLLEDVSFAVLLARA